MRAADIVTRAPESHVNALTFDIEDWHQLVEWKLNGIRPPCSPHVLAQTYEILETLAERRVRATFFILGLVAEAHPALVRDIAAAGHEIGSHGWSHELIYRQTRDTFANEARRSKDVLEQIIARPVAGYRAAEFSVTEQSRWALDVLVECGYSYDSSIFPIKGGRYGIPGTPLSVHVIRTPGGDITEVPLTAVNRRGRYWPVGGGGYFRLLPYSVTRRAIASVNAGGRAAIVYFHPYEFSSTVLVPRLKTSSAYFRSGRYLLFHNMNRHANRKRFLRMLTEFQFAPIADLIDHGH